MHGAHQAGVELRVGYVVGRRKLEHATTNALAATTEPKIEPTLRSNIFGLEDQAWSMRVKASSSTLLSALGSHSALAEHWRGGAKGTARESQARSAQA